MNLSERIRPNSEAAPWVIEEVKKLESYLEVMKINWGHQRDRAIEAEARLTEERAIVDWLGSPEGRRYQTVNPEATLYRETILNAMKGVRYAD